MNEKPVYHQSDLSKFEFCPYGFCLERIEKRRGLSSFFAMRGTGAHVARKVNLRQKIATRKDLSVDVLKDAARDEIKKQVDEGRVDLKSDGTAFMSKAAVLSKLIDTTVKLVEIDRLRLQPRLMPLEVEVKKRVILERWPFDLEMTLDSIDEDAHITDLKTSRCKWSQEKADDEYQPSVYWLGYRAHRGCYPKAFRHHCLTITKTGRTYAYQLETIRGPGQIVAVLERIKAMDRSIQAGVFPPTHQSNWKCSPEWCFVYRDCKYVAK